MGKKSKSLEVSADNQLVVGVQQIFAPSNITLTVAGVTMTSAALGAKILTLVSADTATMTARAVLVKAMAEEKATRIAVQPVINAVKQLAHIMYANAPEVLSVFGLLPRKVAPPLTIEQKAEKAAKAKATRLARNTMGPKAKAKVKGTVPSAAASASAASPGASAGATTTPVVTPGVQPVATAGTGHA